MTDTSILIVSNSQYSYLWPIINNYVIQLNLKNVILSINNNPSNFEFNNNIQIVTYPIELNYAKRMIYLFDILGDKLSNYFILLHDVDLILNFDHCMLKEYLQLITEHDIDRLSLGVFKPHTNTSNTNILNYNNVAICKLFTNMSNNFFTPFDHAPSIYKKSALYRLYSTFSLETYANIETNPAVQQFVLDNFKVYGICNACNVIQSGTGCNAQLLYHRGFVYSSCFSFLHITVKGELLSLELYFDLEDDVKNIIKKYNLSFLGTHAFKGIKKNML